MINFVTSLLVYLLLLVIIFVIFNNKFGINKININQLKFTDLRIIIPCLLMVILFVSPMGLSPRMNGQIPEHRNQYEELAESLINGRVYLEHEVDERLLEFDNVYNYEELRASGIPYEWDHAFYNGHYYMYFGIIPVIITFLPYRLITGSSLLTYHATQIYVGLSVIGFYYLFYIISKLLNREMKLSTYLFLSGSLSAASLWYFITAPALYCTAISSAVFMEIFSLIFFVRSVFYSDGKNSIINALIGSLFGALAFGCRPPVAMGNLLAIPLFVRYIKKSKNDNLIQKNTWIIFLPYVIVGCCLMYYNYIRFESVFEFGQSYQLTIDDQTKYASFLKAFDLNNTLKYIYYYLFNIPKLSKKIIDIGSVFSFPILAYSAILIFDKKLLKSIFNKQLFMEIGFALFTVFVIIVLDSTYSPVALPRYRTDYVWILCIAAYILVSTHLKENNNKVCINKLVCCLCLLSFILSIWLFLYPYDGNYMHYYYPQSVNNVINILTFGLH